jgi:DNA-binding transcriptional MerR regulator
MNNVMEKPYNDQLDEEWIELIKEAKQLGLTSKEIQNFLHNHVDSK